MLYVETGVVRKSLLKSGFDPRSRKVANFEALVLHEKIIFFALVFFFRHRMIINYSARKTHREQHSRFTNARVKKSTFFSY